MSPSSKPVIVVTPGAWHTPDCFDPTGDLLKQAGYEVMGVTLPSVGAEPPLENWNPDVEAIRRTIEAAIGQQGRDVVVVMHSYGGLPTAEAVKGLDKTTRSAAGQQGGVARLVYMSAFFADEGGYLMGFIGDQDLPWFKKEGDDKVWPATPVPTFYHDVDAKEAERLAGTLQHQSYRCFWSKTTYPAWKHVPSTYLICEEDQAIPLAAQEGMIASAPEGTFTVERCKASHSPFISQPEWTAGAIRRAAGESV